MRNGTFGLISLFFFTALSLALSAETPLTKDGKDASPPKKVEPTLRCATNKTVVTLSWAAEAEDPDGDGIFQLSFSGEKETDQTTATVTSFAPKFDPESDLVRYRVGWLSKDFRTTLRLYETDKTSFGDYDSKSIVATGLTCENNLPIRGAKLSFAIDAWDNVSTALALLNCIKFKSDDAIIGKATITLPVRFVTKTDLAKCEARLVSIDGVRCLQLTRVDGTVAPKKEAGAKVDDDKPVKKIERKSPDPKSPER